MKNVDSSIVIYCNSYDTFNVHKIQTFNKVDMKTLLINELYKKIKKKLIPLFFRYTVYSAYKTLHIYIHIYINTYIHKYVYIYVYIYMYVFIKSAYFLFNLL